MITYEKYTIYRDAKKMKDADVAKIAQIPPSTFSDWKSGRCTPKLEKMQKIADALEVDYFELVGPVGRFSSLNPDRDKYLKLSDKERTDYEFMKLFEKADPDVQNAVLTLLRSSEHES